MPATARRRLRWTFIFYFWPVKNITKRTFLVLSSKYYFNFFVAGNLLKLFIQLWVCCNMFCLRHGLESTERRGKIAHILNTERKWAKEWETLKINTNIVTTNIVGKTCQDVTAYVSHAHIACAVFVSHRRPPYDNIRRKQQWLESISFINHSVVLVMCEQTRIFTMFCVNQFSVRSLSLFVGFVFFLFYVDRSLKPCQSFKIPLFFLY